MDGEDPVLAITNFERSVHCATDMLSTSNIPCTMKKEVLVSWTYPNLGWCKVNVDNSSVNDREQASWDLG